MKEKDVMRELSIKQGYVPSTCKLNGILIVGLIQRGEDPCSGCNIDREICKGRKKYSKSDEENFQKHVLECERKFAEEKEKIKRQKEHSTLINLHRLMELNFEYGMGFEIIIKDLVNEKAYCTSIISNISDVIDIAIYYVRIYKIQQIHINDKNYSQILYEKLKAKIEERNMKCDIIPFNHHPLKDDTKLYSDNTIETDFFKFED